MSKKVDVLLDKKAGNLSICSIDDTTCEEVETTLSVGEAWNLVADLNEAIAKLKPEVQIVGNAKFNKEQLEELAVALRKSNADFAARRPSEGSGTITVNVDARGCNDPDQVEAAIRSSIARAMPYIKTNAVSTTLVPEAKHRPYSGTMNT
jgi:hypothetical protein